MWQTYKGDGSKGPFTFAFGASTVNDIVCIVSTGYGDMTLNGADFTVTLNTDQDNNPGGIVTLDQVLPVGHYLTVGLVGQIVQTPNSVERRKGAKSDVVERHLKSIEDQYREAVFKTEKIYTKCADKLDDFVEDEKKVITDKLDVVDKEISDMKTDSESRLAALETSVTNTEENINKQIETTKTNVDKKLVTIADGITLNAENIANNKANIASNKKEIESNDTELADHESRISTLETTSEKQTADIKTNADSISGNTSRITTAETDIDALEDRMTTAESGIATNKANIKSNDSELVTLTARTDTLAANVVDFNKRLENIETTTDIGTFAVKLGEIEDEVTAIQNNYITQDTDQSIWGSKTFSLSPIIFNGYPKFMLQNSCMETGVNGESSESSGLNFYDKNGTDSDNRLGYIEYHQNAQPEDTSTDYIVNNIELTAETQSDVEGAVDGVLGVATTKQGKAYAYAPTPNIKDVSNKVATTEWVNNVATSKIDALSNNITNDLNELKTSLVDNYVTLASEQEITGNKTFKGTLKATTPTSDTVDTTVATTAWANSVLTPIANRVSILESSVAYTNKLLNLIYPVGSIYMSVNNVSPASFLGGTWVALQDRFLIGAGQQYAVNSTGGSTTHTLTTAEMPSHNHTFSGNSLAAHSHNFGVFNADVSTRVDYLTEEAGTNWGTSFTKGIHSSGAMAISGGISSTGSSQAHSIMNPYLAVYMWKRTA